MGNYDREGGTIMLDVFNPERAEECEVGVQVDVETVWTGVLRSGRMRRE